MIGLGICVLTIIGLLGIMWYHEMRVIRQVDRYRLNVTKENHDRDTRP